MIPGPDLVLACPYCESLFRLRSLSSGNTIIATYWTDGYQDNPMMPELPVLSRCPECRRLLWTEQAKQIGEISSELARHGDYELVIDDFGPRRLEAMRALRKAIDCTLQQAKHIVADPPFEIDADRVCKRREMEDDLWAAGATIRRVAIEEQQKPPPKAWRAAPVLELPTAADISEAIAAGLARTTAQELWARRRLWWFHNDARRGDNDDGGPTDERYRLNLERLQQLLQPDDPAQRIMLAETYRELGYHQRALELLATDLPRDYETAASLIRQLAAAGDASLRVIRS
jgi:uncharacterized protein YbaR (Trm112 family)